MEMESITVYLSINLFFLSRSGKNMEKEVFKNATSKDDYVGGIKRLGKTISFIDDRIMHLVYSIYKYY